MKLILLLAAALAVVGVTVAVAVPDAPAHAPADHAMIADARCSHMPDHCTDGARAHG